VSDWWLIQVALPCACLGMRLHTCRFMLYHAAAPVHLKEMMSSICLLLLLLVINHVPV
jgi:hypothetical protein